MLANKLHAPFSPSPFNILIQLLPSVNWQSKLSYVSDAVNISFAMIAIDPGDKYRIVCKIHQIVYSHVAINNYEVAASSPRRACFEQR